MATSLVWRSLGVVPYDDALDMQVSQALKLLNLEDDAQTVFALEHPRTITVGRNGSDANILLPVEVLTRKGFEVRMVDRGGDVTYHGPGQWVLYPVLHLAPWGNDVARFVRNLEEVVIRALAEVGIESRRIDDLPGVWVGEDKICAVGARVKKRPSGEFVTYHGIALNVNTNLQDFDVIVPCGIRDRGVTSVAAVLGAPQDMKAWEDRLRRHFSEVFACEVVLTEAPA
ncbi:lipoyl(octanoyl) transferase LipB [Alicyclobacillus acidocaldarius]|uniref:Octanoyltransferase n=1 Tax=Alicyclobacillus acidocaldarius subsp. acidocaldarius (strain ATCC 27009 / DSM 446 / BCRC 14685 / JCM 5260 / KCTC 1825 / NBRC 15652 / NCIMB 11725 / NRRL B-14509 / 104-IA) TaxID=521098 RepID=C8WXE6_ALIAD|nr:lipoyl(octanoyl) transferase LipB [Alicyclobacillus acidocaldarius]ACV58768.1 lipoate-protein ligase B [Alicyclobacillus acidocaldarius subsp. acidocaldarius DSM 446]